MNEKLKNIILNNFEEIIKNSVEELKKLKLKNAKTVLGKTFEDYKKILKEDNKKNE